MKRFVQTDAQGNVTALVEVMNDTAPDHPRQSDISDRVIPPLGKFDHATKTYTPPVKS